MSDCVIYVRVAGASAGRNGTSSVLARQVEACRQYAAAHGHTVGREVADIASGLLLERPGLNSVRGMVTAGKVQAVIVTDAARLSRTWEDSTILLAEMEQHGAQLLIVAPDGIYQ